MNKEDYTNFIKVKDEVEDLAISRALLKASIEYNDKAGIDEFEYYSDQIYFRFGQFSCGEYVPDVYTCEIDVSDLFDDLDELEIKYRTAYDDELQERKRIKKIQEEKEKKAEIERERKEYNRLKEKFES